MARSCALRLQWPHVCHLHPPQVRAEGASVAAPMNAEQDLEKQYTLFAVPNSMVFRSTSRTSSVSICWRISSSRKERLQQAGGKRVSSLVAARYNSTKHCTSYVCPHGASMMTPTICSIHMTQDAALLPVNRCSQAMLLLSKNSATCRCDRRLRDFPEDEDEPEAEDAECEDAMELEDWNDDEDHIISACWWMHLYAQRQWNPALPSNECSYSAQPQISQPP